MNKRIKAKWIAALRSGAYRQGTGQLRDQTTQKLNRKTGKLETFTGFCCLGVLCNIHAQEHPEIARKQKNPEMYMGIRSFPPTEVVDWAGLPSTHDDRKHADISVQRTLATLNDDKDKSFKQIALWIERYL